MKTSSANLVLVPSILQDTISGKLAGAIALHGTGAAVLNTTLGSTTKGAKVQVPYFGTLGEFDDVTETGILVPAQLTSDQDEAVVQHSGKAFEVTDWARLVSQGDPYDEAATQMRDGWVRRGDKGLIEAARTTDLVKDISAVGNGLFAYDAVVDTKQLWGDEQGNVVAMVVHSKVFGDMKKAKDSTGRQLWVDGREGTLPTFDGNPVIVSDRMVAANGTYETLILKKGALALWVNGSPVVKSAEDILANTHVAAVHMYWIAHRYRKAPGSTKTGVAKLITK